MKFSIEQINQVLDARIKDSKKIISLNQNRLVEMNHKIEELEQLKVIFTRMHEEEKTSFKQLTANEIKNEVVVEYMNKHEGIKEALDVLLKSVCELFPNEEKTLEIIYDPEIEDSWILVTAILKNYDFKNVQPYELEKKVDDVYIPFLEKCKSGWITFTISF